MWLLGIVEHENLLSCKKGQFLLCGYVKQTMSKNNQFSSVPPDDTTKISILSDFKTEIIFNVMVIDQSVQLNEK